MNSSDSLNLRLRQKGRVPAEAFAAQPPSLPTRADPCAGRCWQTILPPEVIGLLENARRAMELNPRYARAVAVQLATLLARPAGTAPARVCNGLAPWQKRKVDRYIADHLDAPILLDDVARQASLSVSHFSRAFKDSYGTTPHMHIIRLRLALAQRLMLTTEESLSQIALACGLANQSHLSRLFRRNVGETPLGWRRRCLPDAEAEARSRRSKASRFAAAPQ
jgi:AraC family transcriptional regulator